MLFMIKISVYFHVYPSVFIIVRILNQSKFLLMNRISTQGLLGRELIE